MHTPRASQISTISCFPRSAAVRRALSPPLGVRVEQLGKLTKATKVYRGVSGMALPEQFWCVFSPVCVAPTPDL